MKWTSLCVDDGVCLHEQRPLVLTTFQVRGILCLKHVGLCTQKSKGIVVRTPTAPILLG